MYGFYVGDYDEDEEEETPPTLRQSEAKIEYDPEYCCVRCKDWFKDVHPNQPDGSFKCWLCRNQPDR